MSSDAPEKPTVQKAIKKNDPVALSQSATAEELQRLKMAEEVLALSRERRKNTSRWALISQSMVGLVAVAGMLLNGFQSYNNRKQQQQMAKVDQDRWNKEFERAQRSDKYRAFFETSLLATDPTNADKRLVGYALLQEFVDDDEYNSKATLMLEESLIQELRTNREAGIDEAHRNAVVAIVTSLSQSPDCGALQRAARSIDKIAKRHARAQDVEETAPIFAIYVRRLLGAAALQCRSFRDFAMVRRPLLETVLRAPEIVDSKDKLSIPEANRRIADVLIDSCRHELEITGVSDCPAVLQHYVDLCRALEGTPERKDEKLACVLIEEALPTLPLPTAAPASAAAEGEEP